ncbi:hypothetical protein [Dictyobacter aurantiacus]|uniref:Uncharacterized protein n=1 Tax=Dictyobacter aurantiacus TaxID=1936993 RepID=A0A401ZBF3_9CHLR|nr:hypothetical protein [Dictyobacter aurantiacus]GCE04241.1 hypothetical protein KDAU_15700 [Dictyobacter aurantiacus]
MADELSVKNAAQLATFVREEDLEDLEKLSKDLEDYAHKAREDGRIYLLQQYTRLMAIVDPEIDRVKKRFKRENLAFLRKEEKRLKKERKTQKDSGGEA